MPSDFTPAAGRAFLTPFYDRAIALTMREETFRPRLVAQVADGDPARVLEVGCGTGSLTVRLADALPSASVVGLDPDPDVLARARGKAAGRRIEWVQGSATGLDFADGTFDCVVASLVLHHLSTEDKRHALAEARRVLRVRGRLHVADWGRPGDPLMRATFTALRALDGFEPTRVHAAGQLPGLIEAAGFEPTVRHDRLRTTWGSLELLESRRA